MARLFEQRWTEIHSKSQIPCRTKWSPAMAKPLNRLDIRDPARFRRRGGDFAALVEAYRLVSCGAELRNNSRFGAKEPKPQSHESNVSIFISTI